MKIIGKEVAEGKINPEDISESTISHYLATRFIPDPEFLIRTSGGMRHSNFLLWQCAYTEFYFSSKMWPELRKEAFYEAIHEIQSSDRRVGKTSAQVVY